MTEANRGASSSGINRLINRDAQVCEFGTNCATNSLQPRRIGGQSPFISAGISQTIDRRKGPVMLKVVHKSAHNPHTIRTQSARKSAHAAT